MTSTLTRIFGLEHLNRAEDVVQETLIEPYKRGPITAFQKIRRPG